VSEERGIQFFYRDGSTYMGPAVREILPYGANRSLECNAPSQSLRDIAVRLEFLRAEAEDEGVSWSKESERDLIAFCSTSTVAPAVYLLENGNLRAVWRDQTGAQVGLQFRGGGQVHYVMFAPRAQGATARLYGVDDVASLRPQVSAAGLQRLLFSGSRQRF
jgi:hypothetical protein